MSSAPFAFATRPARREDAAVMAEIYNQGIADRIATFETEPRAVADIEAWFGSAHVIVAVSQGDALVGYAVAHPYSSRACYRGIGEFSVYVDRRHRGAGVGQAAMTALIEASAPAGLWKLTSRVFPENSASLALMARMGFRVVGVHQNHGRLEGVWKDNVIVERLIQENLV